MATCVGLPRLAHRPAAEQACWPQPCQLPPGWESWAVNGASMALAPRAAKVAGTALPMLGASRRRSQAGPFRRASAVHRQAELDGLGPVVVYKHHSPASPAEHRRCDGSSKAARAVHPRLGVGHLRDAVLELPEGDVEGALEVPGGPFVGTAHVEHYSPVAAKRPAEICEAGGAVARHLAAGELVRLADASACQLVDADARQLALGGAHLLRAFTHERKWGVPRLGPPEESREAVPQFDRDGAGDVVTGEGSALAEVHDPFSRFDGRSELGGAQWARGLEAEGVGSLAVGRPHVRVVARVRGKAREEGFDETVFVICGEGDVRPSLFGYARGIPVGGGGRAEAAEAMGGVNFRIAGQFAGEAAYRAVLGACQLVGEVCTY